MAVISPENYDSDIKKQGLQYQIDRYYSPVEFSHRYRIRIIMEKLNPQPGEKILDLGCGVGTFAFHSAAAGASAWGIDYSAESVKAAESLCRKFNVGDKTVFMVHDATEGLPFENRFFHKIVSADFFEHITDEQKSALLQEMKRILADKGEMVIFTPNALREKLGAIKQTVKKCFTGKKAENPYHFGLINRFKFEKMLKRSGLNFKRHFFDVNYPVLAKLPLLNELLALNLLWTVRKNPGDLL